MAQVQKPGIQRGPGPGRKGTLRPPGSKVPKRKTRAGYRHRQQNASLSKKLEPESRFSHRGERSPGQSPVGTNYTQKPLGPGLWLRLAAGSTLALRIPWSWGREPWPVGRESLPWPRGRENTPVCSQKTHQGCCLRVRDPAPAAVVTRPYLEQQYAAQQAQVRQSPDIFAGALQKTGERKVDQSKRKHYNHNSTSLERGVNWQGRPV